MKAVAYCRVSTKDQVQNLSLPTQVQACKAYCERHELTLVTTFVEQGESAKTADRPQLQKLLQFCRENKGRVHCVVVYNVSRFARDKYDHVVLRLQLHDLGITLRSVTEPIDDTPTGKLMEGVLSAFAQFDNDQKAERTRVGMQAALQRGRWTFKAPIGYMNGILPSDPSLVPDPVRAPIISQAFVKVSEGTPVHEVLKWANAAGLTTLAGAAVSSQSFRTVLRNALYSGVLRVQGWPVDARGDFEPLVNSDVFQLVQLRLSGKIGTRAYEREHPDFPLRQFVKCATCNRGLTGSWSRGRARRYGYYHCHACGEVRVRRESLQDQFVSLLQRLQPKRAYLALFREIVLATWAAERATVAAETQQLSDRLATLRKRLEMLEEAFIYDQSIDRDTYLRQRQKLQDQLAAADLQLQDALVIDVEPEGVLAFAEGLLSNAAGVWREAGDTHQRALQLALFPEGIPYDGENFGTAPTCLAFNELPLISAGENGMASLTVPSWNQIATFLESMRRLRDSAGFAA